MRIIDVRKRCFCDRSDGLESAGEIVWKSDDEDGDAVERVQDTQDEKIEDAWQG